MSAARFHLSLRVADLRASVRFYEAVLGCARTADEGDWCNLDLGGHQLTLHQARGERASLAEQHLDHYGLILAHSDWDALLARLEAAGIPFRLPPKDEGDRSKFVLADPDGIGLEFKTG